MSTETIDHTSATIGELVAADYRKAEIFKRYGLDFCCGGKKTIEVACLEKGADFMELTKVLAQLDESKIEPRHDFNTIELDLLIDHIITTHHSYVQEALPLLDEFSAKVANVHGSKRPEVIEIHHNYEKISTELRSHMHKEEAILFPYIKQLVRAERNNEEVLPPMFGTIRNPITMMETEHDTAGIAMGAIRALSNNFTPPENACNTHRVLYAKLEEFENDLHRHIHLENNILFPKAISLEDNLLT